MEWPKKEQSGGNVDRPFMIWTLNRGVINGKAGKAAALPKFSDTLTLSLPRGADYVHPLALPHLKISLGCILISWIF